MRTKVKKRRINWRELIFYMHSRSLSEEYTLFMIAHPKMSKNRCAYYVLKHNYSTTFLKAWRDIYAGSNYTIPEIMDSLKAKVDYGV